MNKLEKTEQLLLVLQRLYDDTAGEVMSNSFLNDDERKVCINNIFILRKNLALEIQNTLNIVGINSIGSWINYLQAIDVITFSNDQSTVVKPISRYRLNKIVITSQLKLITVLSMKNRERDELRGISDHQKEIKRNFTSITK